MNKTISIFRIVTLFILSGIALILLLCEETDETPSAFILHLFIDKALAIGLFFYVGNLYKRWSRIDPWIKAYDRMFDDVI